MKAYAGEVRKLECHFNNLKLEHVPRGQDAAVKELSWIAAKGLPVPTGAIVEKLSQPSTTPKDEEPGAPSTSAQGAPPTMEQQEGMVNPASERCILPAPTCRTS
jgi:hypothetical protein